MKALAPNVRPIRGIARLLVPWTAMPVYLLLHITRRCDARCAHCFLWRELNTRRADELTLPEFEKFAASLGTMLQITLTGGSPELRPDLPEIARIFHAHCRPTNITICVNGYHTDKIVRYVTQILDSCPKQNLTVGISLDGLRSEHDHLRGMPGLFNRVLATFRELGDIKASTPRLRLASATCVSGLNVATAEETVRWAYDNLPVELVKPILVRGTPRDPNVISPDCIAVYQRIVDANRARLACRRASLLDSLVFAKEDVQRDLICRLALGNDPDFRCSAARQTAVVHSDGTVAGCELRDESLGNLRDFDMDLRRIWFGRTATGFRTRIRRDRCTCYHHCFIAPVVFRSPSLWRRLIHSFNRARRA